MRGGRVHRKIQPVFFEIPVLVVAPWRTPGLAGSRHGAAAGSPHLGV
jgi:hypothetical protein